MKLLFILVTLLLVASFNPSKTYAFDNQTGPSAQLTYEAKLTNNSFDSRVVALENVFRQYNSQLVSESAHYVKYADKYNIDWRLLPAISGLESTFARFHIEGSYNAYGWGGGHIYFASWEDGIEKISKALRENYYDRGANTVYTIAPIYAESKTWAYRVTSFVDEIEVEYQRIQNQSNGLDL